MVKFLKLPPDTPKRRTLCDRLPVPLVAWGPSLFGRHRNEANGSHVAGYRLVRGDDGALSGAQDDDPPEEAA